MRLRAERSAHGTAHERDEIAPGEIERRMSAQPDEKYYRDNSDIIIENPDGCDPTEQCIKALESLKIGG